VGFKGVMQVLKKGSQNSMENGIEQSRRREERGVWRGGGNTNLTRFRIKLGHCRSIGEVSFERKNAEGCLREVSMTGVGPNKTLGGEDQ